MSELVLDKAAENEYLGYEYLIAQGPLYPQRQGMMAEDYELAIADPNTSTTVVSTEQGDVRVPQLSPVTNFSWLNDGFYGNHFSEQMQDGLVFNFTDLKGIEPSQDVKDGLTSLAKKQGILAVDYPDSDPLYLDRVKNLLHSLGIRTEEEVQLGTQTYYVGQFHVKDGVEAGAPIINFRDALVAIQKPNSDTSEGPMYESTVDLDQSIRMSRGYKAAFDKLNDHPCRQGLTPDEFIEVMTKETDVAKVVYVVNGEISTVCLLGDKLDKFEWINPEYFRSQYPEAAANSQILYFPTLATDPEKKGERYAERVLAHIVDALKFGNNEATIAFDCCDINRGFLNVLIEQAVSRTGVATIHFDEVGHQEYKALRLSPA